MDGPIESRGAWANPRKSPFHKFSKLPLISKQISHGGLEIDRLMQKLLRSTSFEEFNAGVERLAELSRIISYNTHTLKLLCDEEIPQSSVYLDHYTKQFYLMSAMRWTWWLEGPAFCGLVIEPGSRILELGCGTGYYTDIFFSPFAAEIVAIDIDSRAIEIARRLHQAKNIHYEVMDCRTSLPEGPFDVVVWTPSIFAYTVDEVHGLMEKLRRVISKNAHLCGWTAVETNERGPEILWYDMKSLAERLKQHFKNVCAFERVHPTIQPPRHELFFFASDGILPFDAEWSHGVIL
jgi:SAM-dependent methyltransferase